MLMCRQRLRVLHQTAAAGVQVERPREPMRTAERATAGPAAARSTTCEVSHVHLHIQKWAVGKDKGCMEGGLGKEGEPVRRRLAVITA